MKKLHTFDTGILGRMDATEIAEKIQQGAFTATEAVLCAVERAKAADPQLNAIVYHNYTRAVAQSQHPAPGIFSGVPTFIKDLNDVDGMPTMKGSSGFKLNHAKKNDKIVDQLLSVTGGVILGKSSTSEFGLLPCGETLQHGETRNPWNTDHSTGGSSAGAAALVAFAPTLGDGPMGEGTWPGAVPGYLAWQKAHPYEVWLSYDLPHKAHAAFITNTTEVELGDNLTLKNIFNWADAFARTPGILSGSPFGSLNLYNRSGLGSGRPGGEEFSTRAVSNELQLQGKSGALEYIVGAFYSNTKKKEYIPVIVGDELPTPLADIAYYYHQRSESKALFAQLSYELTDKLKVTAGGRYTWETAGLDQIAGSLFNLDGTTPLKQKAKLHDPSWTFNLQYQIDSSNMVYFSQRGSFRAGGFNGAVVPFNNTNFFDNETTYDFELGYKFAGHVGDMPTRFNIAAYRQIVKNAQHSIYALVAGNPAAFTVNVPEKRIQGVEFDGNFKPATWFEFGFSGAYTDAKFTKNVVDLSAATGVSGLTIPFDTYTDAPKWAGSVYTVIGLPIPEDLGEVKLRTDVFGQTKTYFSNNEGSITPRTQLPGYVTVDMRLSWDNISGSGFSAAVYAKNLFDKLYYNSGYVEGASGGFNTAIWGEPQTFGAEVTFRF